MANVMQVTHTYSSGGDEPMKEIPKKEFKIGNTTIIVHSKLAIMSDEERSDWWQREYDRGNPIVLRITDAIDACYE